MADDTNLSFDRATIRQRRPERAADRIIMPVTTQREGTNTAIIVTWAMMRPAIIG